MAVPIPEPKKVSPALRFLVRGQQLLRLQNYVLAQVQAETDSDRDAFLEGLPKDPTAIPAWAAGLGPRLQKSRVRISDMELMLQLFFSRHVDNFQIFLEEILRAILVERPEQLKRSDKVSLDKVLSHSTIESFVEATIEEKIHRLAYLSLEDLDTTVVNEMNLRLFPGEKTKKAIALIFDQRNLITHNYGLVNRRFLSRHPNPPLVEGHPYPFTPGMIAEAIKTLNETSAELEKRARRQFKIDFDLTTENIDNPEPHSSASV